MDVGDTAGNKGGKPFAPLFWKAGALGLWDLLHVQVASPVWFSIKGIGLELKSVNLGLLEPLLKAMEIVPLLIFLRNRKKKVHSSRARVLSVLPTAAFLVWTALGT